MPRNPPSRRIPVRRAVRFLLVALAASGATATATATAGDPAEGHALAAQWCSNCHAIEPGGRNSDQIPSFEFIARERNRSAEWISTWLQTPHEAMPNFSLSRNEIAALVAYFESLR